MLQALREVSFSATRFNVPLCDAGEFQERYEQAVPPLPFDQVAALAARRAPWSEMLELISSSAPHGFLIYAKSPVDRLMSLAGHSTKCTAYQMGNHTIAEKMFQHDPSVMLYAPLRTLICEDTAHNAWFTVDLPSAQFGSFGMPAVAEVGLELDAKLAALLKALKVEVPSGLVHG
jgi:uncharacterized protein (DUF302 family)